MEINIEYIDVEGAVKRIGGNKGLYIKLLNQFTGGSDISSLEETLSAGDIETAARLAHTIKGTSANLSLSKLTSAALELEMKLKNGEDYAQSLSDLKDVFNTTKQQATLVNEE